MLNSDPATADDRALLEVARKYAGNAHAPLSNYHVGAALRCRDEAGNERIIGGCNVEHIILSLSNCAERVALQTAVAEGLKIVESVAVYTASSPPAAPCGPCRQFLFSWKVHRVVLGNDQGEIRVVTLADLLPLAFDLDGPVR